MFEVLQKKNVNFFIIKKIFIFNSKNNNKQNKLQKCVIKQKSYSHNFHMYIVY